MIYRYEELINDAAAFYNVRPEWVSAVLWIESRGEPEPPPRWEAHKQEHSYGLGQLLPSTVHWMLDVPSRFPLPDRVRARISQAREGQLSRGESSFAEGLHDPEVNIYLTTAYLRYQLDRYDGNITDAVAAYNAGSVRKKNGAYVNQWHVDKFHNALDLRA